MHGMPTQAVDWNDEAVATLKRLWAAGCSHSQIAPEIPYATRSAIAGKIMRLKLPSPDRKNSRGGHLPRPSRSAASAPAPRPGKVASLSRTLGEAFSESKQRRNPTNSIAEKIAIAEAEPGLSPILKGEKPDGTGIKFHELTKLTCHWPKGDPIEEDFEFCGGKALPDLPYCAHHSRIAYAPPRARVAADKWALHRADLKS